MEEPFRKRPRLSIFADQPTETELDEDLGSLRYKNDKLLKTRFESIFEKYSQDFTGVGDEIDIVKGRVVVNNGHLESMEDETDIGDIPVEDSKGRSFLRAMTEAPDGGDPYSHKEADDVITSIEGIAENAAMSDEETHSEESESESSSHAQSHSSYDTPRKVHKRFRSDANDSDTDSLFEAGEPERSTSPDSLFAVGSPKQESEDIAYQLPEAPHLGDEEEESVVLRKYGPEMGKEVLDMLQRARTTAVEAQVEPAWRLPMDLIPPKPQKPTRLAPTSNTPSRLQSSDRGDTPSLKLEGSVWRSTRRPISPLRQGHRRLREDSVDPLQQGLSGDEAEQSEPEHAEVIWKSNRSNGRGNDKQAIQMKQGICFYCSRQWKTRSSVFNHWKTLVVDAVENGAPHDGVHDIAYMRDYVLCAPTGARGPKLGVANFRKLIELHEGAGQSFDEIAESGLLRTKKNASQLKEAFIRYRKPRGTKGKRDARKWSESELETLDRLCQNPKSDISSFTRSFENCRITDVVDKLAEIWLAEWRQSTGEAVKQSESPESEEIT